MLPSPWRSNYVPESIESSQVVAFDFDTQFALTDHCQRTSLITGSRSWKRSGCQTAANLPYLCKLHSLRRLFLQSCYQSFQSRMSHDHFLTLQTDPKLRLHRPHRSISWRPLVWSSWWQLLVETRSSSVAIPVCMATWETPISRIPLCSYPSLPRESRSAKRLLDRCGFPWPCVRRACGWESRFGADR